MKQKRNRHFKGNWKRIFQSVAFWGALVLVVTLVLVSIFLQSEEDINKLKFDLLEDLLSAATVGVVATLFTEIITNKILAVKRNNDKLKEFGVKYIGTGISSPADIRGLFGNPLLKKYPSEIKLMFISGNGFFLHFQKDLLKCLQNSNCTVKVLLLSTDPSNLDYARRMERICHQERTYFHQVDREAICLLQSVVDQLEERKKGQIQLRFYKDEYRYNFRIAKYCNGDEVSGKCWLNIQPLNRDAAELSIGLNGEWDDESSLKSNVFALLDDSFDQLWEDYAHTEHTFL